MQQQAHRLQQPPLGSFVPHAVTPPVPPAAPRAQTRIIRGRERILALQSLLADFASRCEQTGEADSLYHFLCTPDALKKRPALVLIGRGAASPVDSHGTPILAELAGIVLVFEYLGLPRRNTLPTRVYATTDGTGRRHVLAPPGQRARITGLGVRALVEAGARIVQLDFSETYSDRSDPPALTPASPDTDSARQQEAILKAFREGAKPLPRSHWNLNRRVVQLHLPLLSSFDETLARIGQKTRANLRYYRRKAEAELGAEFVPDVRSTAPASSPSTSSASTKSRRRSPPSASITSATPPPLTSAASATATAAGSPSFVAAARTAS